MKAPKIYISSTPDAFFWLFWLIIITSAPFQTLKAQVNLGDDSIHGIFLLPHSEIYLEDINDLSLNKILQNETRIHKRIDTLASSINLGITDKSCWLKCNIINTSDYGRSIFIELARQHTDSIELFLVSKGKVLLRKTFGDHYDYDDREIDDPIFISRIRLAPQDNVDLVIKFKTAGNLNIAPRIISFEQYQSRLSSNHLLIGIYYGSLLIIILYNIMMYFSAKEKSYLYYSFYAVCLGVFLLSWNGLGYKYIWPSSPWFQNRSILFSGFAWIFFGLLFSIRFLRLKVLMKPFFRLFRLMLIVTLIGFITVPLATDFMMIFTPLYIIAIGIMMMVVAIKGVWMGYKPARYFTLAWGVFLLSFILTSMGVLGANLPEVINEYTIQIGSMCELVFLSIGIGERVRMIRKSKEEAQMESVKRTQELYEIKARANVELEEKVKERTRELREQKVLVEERNEEINESMAYAQSIQNALLPSSDRIKSLQMDHFIFSQSKEPVSGDFLWHYEDQDFWLIAVADCTGHGIPGGLLSIMAFSSLNQVVKEMKTHTPKDVLNRLNKKVVDSFLSEDEHMQEGMDISIIKIFKNELKCEFAGAKNNLYISDGSEEVKQYEGNRFSIGNQSIKHQMTFTQKTINLKRGDCLFMLSDGLIDQFGGKSGKKFKSKRLSLLLMDLYELKAVEQKAHVKLCLNKWMGHYPQIDDIMMLGIRI